MAENKVVIEFVGDVSGLKPAIDTLSQLGNLSEEQVNAFKKANDQFKQATKSAGDTEKSVSKLSTSFKQISGAVAGKAIAEPLKELGKATEQATTKTVSLKAELRALKAQIAQLDEGTAEFEKLAQRAAQLEDQIGDVNERVRVLASDTFKFDAAVGAIRGVTAAFSVAQGAAALFGEENEDVQKALLKVQAATALLTGVQELANIATGQGALKLAVLSAAQKANVAITTIATRAQQLFAASTALMTGGIIALLGGLVALVMNYEKIGQALGIISTETDNYTAKLKEQLEQQRQLNIEKRKRLESIVDELKLEAELSEITASGTKESKEKGINALQAERQLKLQEILSITEKIERLTELGGAKRLQVYDIDAERFELLKKEATEKVKILEKEERILQAKILKLEKEKDTTKELEKQDDILGELVNKLRKSFSETLLGGENEKKVEDAIKKVATMYVENMKRANKDIASGLGELLGKVEVPPIKIPVELENAVELQKYLKEQLPADVIKAVSTITDSIFQIAAQNRQAQFELEQAQLDERREKELNNKNLTESQKVAIEKKFEQQRAAIRQRQFQAEKQAAIAQAVINGALAVTNILATTPKTDFGAATIALLALNTIQTGAQIAVISSQKAPKFAKGGFIGGKPHSQGGTIIEAEKDEFVVRKSIAKQNKSFLEAFNNGVPIAKALERASFMPSIKDNDLIVLENKANIDYSKLGRAVAREMSKLPQSELQVNYRGLFQSINSQQSLIEWQKRKYN